MKTITVVYHSGSGHTRRQAEAVVQGCLSVEGITAALIDVSEVEQKWQQLDDADAIIMGSPTYFGSASAQFKAFCDSCGGRFFEQRWKNKIAAGFTNSGGLSGDKQTTLIQIFTFAQQMGMIWIGLGILSPSGEPTPEKINRLDSFIGAMAQSTMGDREGLHPSSGDLETAKQLGIRVSGAVLRWNS